jgi:hypothetical protein
VGDSIRWVVHLCVQVARHQQRRERRVQATTERILSPIKPLRVFLNEKTKRILLDAFKRVTVMSLFLFTPVSDSQSRFRPLYSAPLAVRSPQAPKLLQPGFSQWILSCNTTAKSCSKPSACDC